MEWECWKNDGKVGRKIGATMKWEHDAEDEVAESSGNWVREAPELACVLRPAMWLWL